jgi:hypothetical protein
MGLLNNKDWSGAVKQTLAKCTVKVCVKDMRDVDGKVTDDGRQKPDCTFITLQLLQDAADTDGGVFKAGGTVDVALNTSPNPDDDPKLATMNRISQERFRELIVAALQLDPKCRDAAEQFEQAGGKDAIKDKIVVADLAPSKVGTLNVSRFSRVAS